MVFLYWLTRKRVGFKRCILQFQRSSGRVDVTFMAAFLMSWRRWILLFGCLSSQTRVPSEQRSRMLASLWHDACCLPQSHVLTHVLNEWARYFIPCMLGQHSLPNAVKLHYASYNGFPLSFFNGTACLFYVPWYLICQHNGRVAFLHLPELPSDILIINW